MAFKTTPTLQNLELKAKAREPADPELKTAETQTRRVGQAS
jgi:hypothetical protein